jgi:hypothetical protein
MTRIWTSMSDGVTPFPGFPADELAAAMNVVPAVRSANAPMVKKFHFAQGRDF